MGRCVYRDKTETLSLTITVLGSSCHSQLWFHSLAGLRSSASDDNMTVVLMWQAVGIYMAIGGP